MEESRYRMYRIRKANRRFRTIMEPDPALKSLQRSILRWLMARRIRASKYAHGFVKGRSTTTNAALHVGKRVVVRIDIQDFFPTITERQVKYALTREGLLSDDAARIADLCTVEGKLPQGAPTSPFLSNMIFRVLDYRLAGLAKKWGATYSRYADDLIFSSDRDDLQAIYHPVASILEEDGFEVNPDKFRVYRSTRRQRVTGIVVNHHPTLPRESRRRLRAALHHVRRSIVTGEEVPAERLDSIEGSAAYLTGIDRERGRRLLVEVRDLKALLALRTRMVSRRRPRRTSGIAAAPS